MQTLLIYLDDSGVLHKNDQYFVYGGYFFMGFESRDSASREYQSLITKIRKATGLRGELKSSNLRPKTKRALTKVLDKYESLSVCVDNNQVHQSIMDNKKSIHRFKDYAIKRLLKAKLMKLISEGKINPNEDIRINLYIDEQATATNGYYDLQESIEEEFKNGIRNFDYGTFHPPIFFSKMHINIQYCDSSCNYLIQASDILANKVWCSHLFKNPHLRNKNNHFYLHLP